jgi:hypothetical protein
MNTTTADINAHLGNSIDLIYRVLDLYDRNKTITPADVSKIFTAMSDQDKHAVEWAYEKLKSIGLKNKKIDINAIHIKQEQNSKDLAIGLLRAIGKTLPGKQFPSGDKMATDLGLNDPIAKQEFITEYNLTVDALRTSKNQHKINSMDQSLIMWAWIGRGLAGTLLVFVLFFIGRKLYELAMEIRKSIANFVMPTRKQLSKFKLFTFLGKRKKPRLVPTFVQATDEDGDDDNVET